MKERRYVKLRSDMYEDTKSKIIDMHLKKEQLCCNQEHFDGLTY